MMEEYHPVQDYDPEDELHSSEDDEEGPDVDDIDPAKARDHYEPVSKSKLRHRDEVALGPGYEGSRTDRKRLDDDYSSGRNPFMDYGSDELSDEDLAGFEDGVEDQDDPSVDGDGDSGSADSDDDDDDESSDDASGTDNTSFSNDAADDRAELRRLMHQGRASVTSTMAEATRADAEKGRAVLQQRKAFDALLNGRIRMQQALVATNTMPTLDAAMEKPAPDALQAAESALTRLWNSLDDLRLSLADTRTGGKRKRIVSSTVTPSKTMWEHMQSLEQDEQPRRRKVLENWSLRTQSASAKPASGRLNQSIRQTTFVDVLDEQLANPDRLIKRAQMPRSAAPVQARQRITESSDIFDDADFYGVMLKELLEQRNVDAASSHASSSLINEQWQAARQMKTKKVVDTKASKGRKMRFTVHEKLQNFMAPEDRGTWGQRQVDELFGSLLGKRMAVAAVDDGGEEDDERMGEEIALKLFRN